MINRMKFSKYIILAIMLLSFVSCDFSELGNASIFILFGFLILCFIIMFVVIFKTQRNETKKMNQYVVSVNNMLSKCKSIDHKERELKILIERIENDPKYLKNESWKNKVLAKTYLFLATLYYNQNDEKKVLDTCNKILILTPDDMSTLYNRGALLLNKGQYENAIEDFTTCILSDDKNVNALNNRGLAYEKINENDKALTDYLKALDIDESAILYLNLGNLYKKINDPSTAKKYYQKGIEICDDQNIMNILQNGLSSVQ